MFIFIFLDGTHLKTHSVSIQLLQKNPDRDGGWIILNTLRPPLHDPVTDHTDARCWWYATGPGPRTPSAGLGEFPGPPVTVALLSESPSPHRHSGATVENAAVEPDVGAQPDAQGLRVPVPAPAALRPHL